MFFITNALLTLKSYGTAHNKQEELEDLKQVKQLSVNFNKRRANLENVYGKSRILFKPNNYMPDQDHHSHLANQTISFDWQFYAEMLF